MLRRCERVVVPRAAGPLWIGGQHRLTHQGSVQPVRHGPAGRGTDGLRRSRIWRRQQAEAQFVEHQRRLLSLRPGPDFAELYDDQTT